MTIFEAKGLEFDDVILFNFFKDSSIKLGQWGLMKNLLVSEKLLDKNEFLKTTTLFDIFKKDKSIKS